VVTQRKRLKKEDLSRKAKGHFSCNLFFPLDLAFGRQYYVKVSRLTIRGGIIKREKRKGLVINLKRIFTSNKQKTSLKDLRKTIICEHATFIVSNIYIVVCGMALFEFLFNEFIIFVILNINDHMIGDSNRQWPNVDTKRSARVSHAKSNCCPCP
jgi:hypothetical protein